MARTWGRRRGLLLAAAGAVVLTRSGGFLSVSADETATSVAGGVQGEEDAVLELDADSLDSAVENHGLLMLNFCAPWSEHCKQLTPEYAKAALDLRGDNLLLGKVDCDANEDLCEEDRWDLVGFPAIKVVRGTTVHDYTGARAADDIAAFMREVAAFEPDFVQELPDPDSVRVSLDSEHNLSDSESEDEDDDDVAEDEEDGLGLDLIEEDGLLLLGADNLHKVAETFVLMLVFFSSAGCKECPAIAEVCAEAADELYQYLIPVAKVDCDVHKVVCDEPQWGAATLPTLKAYRDGDIFTYFERPVTAKGIVDFMKGLAGIGDDYDPDEDADDAEAKEDKKEDAIENGVVDESNVMVVDAKNIEAALAENDVLMIEFMAPWCGNCKRFAPHYAKAADMLIGEGIRLAKVDCNADEWFCADPRWAVEYFPTMYVFKKGRFHQYEGEQEQKAVVDFMKEVVKPSPVPLASVEELEAFKAAREVSIVGLFGDADSAGYKAFVAMAEGEINSRYGVSLDENVRRVNGAAESDKVVCFKTFDDLKAEFPVTKATTKDELRGFVETASRRLVLEMGSADATKFLDKRKGVAMFIMTEDEGQELSAETDAILSAAKTLARTGANPVTYIHAKRKKDGEGVVGYILGLSNVKDRLPAVALVHPPVDYNGTPIKYVHDGELSAKGLQEFERAFFDGKLKPHMRSEALLATDKNYPVRVVKGLSFEEMVIDNENDVLLEFYAPWCTFCQQLAPIYTELGVQMAASGRDKLVVAKIDATNNDLNYPQIPRVSKFPSIFLFPGNAKDAPITYAGDNDLPSLMAFVEAHAYHKPSLPDRYTEL